MVGEEVRVNTKEGAEVLNPFSGKVLENKQGLRGNYFGIEVLKYASEIRMVFGSFDKFFVIH